MGSVPVRPHGTGVRGANLSRSSVLFGGPFGRLFRALPPADFGGDDAASLAAIDKLAKLMVSKPDREDPKDRPDDEESGIPALYTYFGQFIDHDLTFDPASSLQRQNDPDALVDYRTPRFDLDNVYGRGPDDQPYMYADALRFALGERALTGGGADPRATDLPRAANGRAVIGDPRNDENVIVSQLQGLFLRYHNGMAGTGRGFADVQRSVRFHYQWLVLNDYLPTVVSRDALASVLPHLSAGSDPVASPPRLSFFKPRNEAFMPLEFSAAAYRFGHSMVRPGYRLNDAVKRSIFAGDPDGALTGFRPFPADWAIDWRRFIDLEPMEAGNGKDERDPANRHRLQLAYKIDTSIVSPLGRLPETVAGPPPHSLARRNLERGWRMRLPSGQDVARAMGLVPLADAGIRIGKFTGDEADIVSTIGEVDPGFVGNCPLWTYVLAETVEEEVHVETKQGTKAFKARKLGPVGGRIVAETVVGLLLADSSSYLAQDPLWTPWRDGTRSTTSFRLRDLVSDALR